MLLDYLLAFCLAPEGDDPSPGGDNPNPPVDDPDDDDDDSDDPPPGSQVSRAKYEKARKEAYKAREKLRLLEAAEAKKIEDAQKEQGKYKDLLATREAELEKERAERKAEREKLFSDVVNHRREKSLKDAIGQAIDAKFNVILKDYADKIKIDDEGKPDETSAKKLADDFRKQYPELFGSRTSPGAPNPKGGGDSRLTKEQWKAMPMATQEQRDKKKAAMALVDL